LNNYRYLFQLNTAYKELNKRIFEHDNAAAEGFDKPELTLQVRGNKNHPQMRRGPGRTPPLICKKIFEIDW
jgi:hypothetical protein